MQGDKILVWWFYFIFLKEMNIEIGVSDCKTRTEGGASLKQTMFFLNRRSETRNVKCLRLMYGLQDRVLLILLSLQLIIGSLEHL